MTTLRHAAPGDLPLVVELLKDCGLPHQDLGAAQLPGFFVAAGDGDTVFAAIGLERHGGDGLLRSLAVRPGARSAGLGSQLVTALERQAHADGVQSLYLLTTTAAGYFERKGYQRIARAGAPAALQASPEFSSLCPSQAVCMRKLLG